MTWRACSCCSKESGWYTVAIEMALGDCQFCEEPCYPVYIIAIGAPEDE